MPAGMGSAMTNPLLEAALHYAQIGLPVAPLHTFKDGWCSCGSTKPHKVGKHPRTPNGVKDATLLSPQVKTWWRRWIDANIMGAIPRRVYVLEIDSADGVMTLHERGVDFEGAPRVRTGRDGLGLHLWYRSELALPNCPDNTVVKDVGFRGFGEYVLMPPSLHPSGRRYAWEIPFAGPLPNSLPEVPPALVQLVQHTKRAQPSNKWYKKAFTPVPPGQQARMLLSLCHYAMQLIPEDQWPHMIVPILTVAAAQYPLGDPMWPWGEADFVRIYEQASRRVDPVPLPEEPPARVGDDDATPYGDRGRFWEVIR
jgi:hypothetical protein